MSADYFNRLEAELRAAVPSGNIDTHGRPRWRRHLGGGIAIAASLAVVVVVILVFIPLHGERHTPARPKVLHQRGSTPGEFLYPLGSTPTLRQLLDNFAILRRPQSARDRSWQPNCDCAGSARQLNDLTRLAATLPSGYRVFLDVEQLLVGGQLGMAAGSYVLNFTVVDPHGPTSGSSFGPNTNFSVFPISSGGRDAVWTSVVPDGVGSVRWTFGCRGGSRCAGIRSRTFTVPVVNNVAAREIAGADNCSGCASPQRVAWLSADGRSVASFPGFGNVPAPPFINGSRATRDLRVLNPTGVGDARLGQPVATVTRTIERLLGPAAQANVRTGGCGIDHESVWTSPAAADPLTIFERRGVFVGYQYGAPVQQIGLVQGPGAVLVTGRGLALGDTVAEGTRFYGRNFLTSAAGGGTWHAPADGGTLRGSVLPITYPLRTVTAKNQVATIAGGATGCPPKGH